MQIGQRKKCSLLAFFVIAFLIVQTVFPNIIFAAQSSEAPQNTSFSISINDDGTANITDYKYKRDSSYTSVVIPKSIGGIKITGISDNAFNRAVFLQHIYIPDTIREIGKNSFNSCMSLKEITIPGSVSKIGTFAFMSCRALEKVTILYGVQSIGDGAFASCIKLNTVTIAPSAEIIEAQAFNGSGGVTIQANPDSAAGQYDGSGVTLSKAELPFDSPAAYKYTIDEKAGEVIIQDYVGTSTTPVIPDKINEINVMTIDDGAFQDKPITQVTLPASLKTIGSNAFAGTKLTVVEIPSSVTGIGAGAFNDNSSITLKGDTSAIDEFLNDSKYIKFVPWGPGRTKYHEVTIESEPYFGGAIIQGRSKEYKEGTSITIEAKPYTPADVISSDVGTYVFDEWIVKGSSSADSVIPSDLKNNSKIVINMPSYDIKLTAKYKLIPPNPLVIKNGVVVLYTGNGSSKLEIPSQWRENEGGELEAVHTIGSNGTNGGVVFLDSTMKEISIPDSINTILSTVFNAASGLETITVDDNNKFFSSENGILFNKDKTKLIAYPANKQGSSYTIPDSVIEIGDYAFYNNKNLKSINLNNTELIGRNAFAYSNLTEITFNGSVKKISAYAFAYTSKLSSVTFSESVEEIDSYAFAYIPKLTDVNFANSIVKIGDYAFAYDSLLNSVNIPSSVSYLGTGAFYKCTSLETVNWDQNSNIDTILPNTFAYCPLIKVSLPNGIKTISNRAYAYCNELNSVTLSRTITNLSSGALYGCNRLAYILVEPDNEVYSDIDGILFNADATVLKIYPVARPESSYVVPESVIKIDNDAFAYAKFTDINISNATAIGNNAFAHSNITAINLQNITEIGNDAFYNCLGLQEVTWPSAVSAISSYVFASCANLEKVIIPETVTSIGNGTFSGCKKLTEIVLPEGLTNIGSYSFNNCTSLEEINWPSSLGSIGSYAFAGCVKLKSAEIPTGVSSIGNYAFSGCSGLKSVEIPESSLSIGSYAFSGCTGLTSVNVPSTVSASRGVFNNCTGLTSAVVGLSSIPDYMFYKCSNLANLTLNENIDSIGAYAFGYCGNLDNIIVDSSSIGSYAFYQCSKLNKITLLNNVNTIGSYAFSGCNALENIIIPSSVSDIGYKAFHYCEGLENITVDKSNSYYADQNGVLFNKEESNLIFYPQNKQESAYTTSDTVETISEYAFESVNNLTEVIFTDNVSDFAVSVFYNAPKISKITVSNKNASFASTSTYPSKTLFYGISDSILKNLVVCGYMGSTIENEVFVHRIKGIKFMALDPATKGLVIQKIEKNSNQRTVDNLPLNENTWLGEVVGYNVPDELSSSAEAKNIVIPSLVTSETEGIIVRDESGDEITLNEGESIVVSSIGTHALWYPGSSSSEGTVHDTFVRSIVSVTLPQTITDIKTNAFEDCTALNSFVIPHSVQNIYPYAFSNCSALTEITIPENVAMLGEDKLIDEISKNEVHTSAFVGCTNLKEINVDPENKKYASIDGVLMNYDKNKIYEAPNGFVGNADGKTGKYIVPDSVETIGSSAFVGCRLNDIEFPASMKHIGVNAFNSVLTTPDSVISFNENSEENLDIDNGAFENCTGLTRVNLPPVLDRIGDMAFNGCTSLEYFYIPDTAEDYHTENGVLMTHTVSDEGVEAYIIYMYPEGRTDETYEVPDDVNGIHVYQIYDGAFQNNRHLNSIVLSDDVQYIGENAFRNCSELSSAVWGSNIRFIGSYAFAGTVIKNISLPDSVSNIGMNAFDGCGLESAEIYCRNAQIGENAFNGCSEEFVLKGFANSTAEDYARNNNLNFEVLDFYDISVAGDILNGQVDVDKDMAAAGDVINIYVTPNDGYRLIENSLKYNGIPVNNDDTNYYFEMPNENVVITAEFEYIASDSESSEQQNDSLSDDNDNEGITDAIESEDIIGDIDTSDVLDVQENDDLSDESDVIEYSDVQEDTELDESSDF